jgi:hypothetical protein
MEHKAIPLKIEEFNVETVKRMVEFLYTKAYGNPTEERGSEGVSSQPENSNQPLHNS